MTLWLNLLRVRLTGRCRDDVAATVSANCRF